MSISQNSPSNQKLTQAQKSREQSENMKLRNIWLSLSNMINQAKRKEDDPRKLQNISQIEAIFRENCTNKAKIQYTNRSEREEVKKKIVKRTQNSKPQNPKPKTQKTHLITKH